MIFRNFIEVLSFNCFLISALVWGRELLSYFGEDMDWDRLREVAKENIRTEEFRNACAS
jgi:hypothetical protein